jgi:hypothetical protein
MFSFYFTDSKEEIRNCQGGDAQTERVVAAILPPIVHLGNHKVMFRLILNSAFKRCAARP